jgi:hypothetical protein
MAISYFAWYLMNKLKKPSAKVAEAQLNIRPFPDELLRRVSAVAGARGQTQKQFVIDALEERTKDYKGLVEEIFRREAIRKGN